MAVIQLPKTTAVKEQGQVEAHVATGEAAAAFLADEIGCFIIGMMITLAAVPALVNLKNALTWSNPVGPLSGKTGVGVIAFVLVWGIALLTLKDKDVNVKTFVIAVAVLTGLGFLLTFPPFFDLFAGA